MEKAELYDLKSNIEENIDVGSKHPDMVKKLEAEAERTRVELGDKFTNRTGQGIREPGRIVEEALVR